MMPELVEVLVRASIIGVAGAALMDVWGAFSRHALRVQGLDRPGRRAFDRLAVARA